MVKTVNRNELAYWAHCQIIKLNSMSKKVDFKKSIQGLNDQDLQARIKEDEMRLKKLEFAHALSPLENPMTIRNLRRELARLKTELKKKQLSA